MNTYTSHIRIKTRVIKSQMFAFAKNLAVMPNDVISESSDQTAWMGRLVCRRCDVYQSPQLAEIYE